MCKPSIKSATHSKIFKTFNNILRDWHGGLTNIENCKLNFKTTHLQQYIYTLNTLICTGIKYLHNSMMQRKKEKYIYIYI